MAAMLQKPAMGLNVRPASKAMPALAPRVVKTAAVSPLRVSHFFYSVSVFGSDRVSLL